MMMFKNIHLKVNVVLHGIRHYDWVAERLSGTIKSIPYQIGGLLEQIKSLYRIKSIILRIL